MAQYSLTETPDECKPMALSFGDVQFSTIDRDGQPWFRSSEIARALKYSSEKSITNLYARNADEFSNDMTVVITLMTNDGVAAETRIFSLRGCHLLAMFARTTVAKAFHRWVLDVLDRLAAEERARLAAADSLPEASVTLTPSTTADREPLRAIVNAWSRIGGQPQNNLWPQVRAAFNITNIKELPAEWIPDAVAWVQAKIDALNQARALPQTPPAPPAPRPTPPSLLGSLVLPRFDEAPYQEFVEDCKRAHAEVNAILERVRNRAIKLSAPLLCEMQTRMIASGMTAGAAIDLALEWHDHLYYQCFKALTYPNEDLPSYHNPAYSLLKYVRALNG